jgi:hypothetical protein
MSKCIPYPLTGEPAITYVYTLTPRPLSLSLSQKKKINNK